MTVGELMKELRAIVKVHPEAKDAQVIATAHDQCVYVEYIAYDTKRKPSRMKLEQA